MRKSSVFLSLAVLAFGASLATAAGEHSGLGQRAGLNVSVQFLNPSGHTTTDAGGIHYNLWDYYLVGETLYYKSSTWGQLFPLFFLGQTVNFTVTVTNVAPGNKHYRVVVKGLANDLRPPYVIGESLAAPQDWVLLLNSGETKVLSGQIALTDPNTPSGLDLVRIQVWNEDMGQGKNQDMIGEWDAIFCPPNVNK